MTEVHICPLVGNTGHCLTSSVLLGQCQHNSCDKYDIRTGWKKNECEQTLTMKLPRKRPLGGWGRR